MNHDWSVGGVEELDRIRALLSTNTIRLQRQLDTEALKINNHQKDDKRGHQVGNVGQVGSEEGFPKSTHLVRTSDEQMNERNDSALKLGT